MKIFISSKEALQASRKKRKNINNSKNRFSYDQILKRKRVPNPESYIDDLLKTEQVQNALKDEFVILLYDQKESSIDDQMFIKQKYFYDYSPNAIFLNSKAQTIAYLKLNLYELNFDLVKIIYDSVMQFDINSNQLRELEESYTAKSISPNELTELIKLRSNLCLRSKEYWNYYTTLNAKLPTDAEFSWSTFCKENFSIRDLFFKFLMEADTSYNDIKLSVLNNLKELRYMENDIENYQYLTAIADSLTKEMFNKNDDASVFLNAMFPDLEGGMEEANSMKMIEMFSKLGDDKLLIETAEKYMSSFFEGYNERINNQIKRQDAILEALKETLIADLSSTDTAFNWDNFKRKSIENDVKSMNEVYSNDLNQIAWAYYEIVDSKMDLNNAIDWCQKAIEFHSGKENNDTLAHLYFKTGNRGKAIEYQTIALTIAESEGLRQEKLKYYSDELEKFKTQ